MAVTYMTSLGSVAQLPSLIKDDMLDGNGFGRIAMVGRSNVGKSSLINGLVKSRIALTSKQPGHTRKINFFNWSDRKTIIADLPGYGFAQRSKKEQAQWAELISEYMQFDKNLKCALVLLDARHGPTPKDAEAIEFLQKINVPIQLVFTKKDALKNQKNLAARRKETKVSLEKIGFKPSDAIWVASRTGEGIPELNTFLRSVIS